MAWDASLPGNATKLRLSPAIFQANWTALETGEVPYDKLKMQEQGGNPTREDNYGFIFSKDPGTGVTELFYQDDQNPAEVTQLTSNGTIGSPTQASISAWGNIASNGVANGIFGATSAKTSTGVYTITFSTPLSTANYAVTATATSNPISASYCTVETYQTGSFVVRTRRVDNETVLDNAFSFMVVGGR